MLRVYARPLMPMLLLSSLMLPQARAQSQTSQASTPAPTSTAPDSVPALPAYRHKASSPQGEAQPTEPAPAQETAPASTTAAPTPRSQTPQSLPVPQKAPPPVVTNAPPTQEVPFTAEPAYGKVVVGQRHGRTALDALGSAYIPVDSWVYPAMMRLYSMGYLDSMFLSARPYTRRSALHILQKSEDAILSSNDTEAEDILSALLNELTDEGIVNHDIAGGERGRVYGMQSVYTRVQGISGAILQDSYHLGQSFFNDYGRPHNPGFNNITGFSTLAEQGRWSLYVRGEYQHAPSGPGYSHSLAALLSEGDPLDPLHQQSGDGIPYSGYNARQDTIPEGPVVAQNPFRIVEATLSFHLLGHEISGGKSDAWLGPAFGGGMAWSNNAENIYSFRINRVEPLRIPFLSRITGPVRYDFFYGSLKGHTYPNNDWTHSDTVTFSPTRDFQFSFQRTIVFGGRGHEPVTIHTFLKGFFDISDTTVTEKYSRDDPGARFSSFTFSYRLPFAGRSITLYSDSETHDDLFPISAPHRAGWRPGLYFSRLPGAPHLDLRVEATYTDCDNRICNNGNAQYYETIQRQAYTNKGYLFGDWIGREAKGGQAWLTYHLSGNESVQLSYLNKKTATDFIPGGTTQNQFALEVVKRLRPDIELNASYRHEGWKAPVYLAGAQSNNTFTFQVTFFPKLKTTAP